MKILLINNFHYLRGGSERAYLDVAKILEENGHEVAFFSTKHPKTLPTKWDKYFVKYYELGKESQHGFFDKIKIVLKIWYNLETRRKLRNLLTEFDPDVAHMHNIFHHLSTSVVDELKKHGIPTVMTLHDYKFICPSKMMFSNGEIWEKNKTGKNYRCVIDKCVQSSYSKSIICAIEARLNRILGAVKKVDLLTSPSNFLAEKSREFGFKKEIIKLPNPVLFDDELAVVNEKAMSQRDRDYIIYFGRLGEEKGVQDLVVAFAKIDKDIDLLIAGDGPEREKLERMTRDFGAETRIKFLGHMDKKELFEIVRGALFFVSPSRCYENAPYTILETMSLKKPVICANLGGPNEMINDGRSGLLFEAGNVDQLTEKMKFALENKEEMNKMAQRGYLDVIRNNSSEVYLSRVMAVYNQAIAKQKSLNGGHKGELKIKPSK